MQAIVLARQNIREYDEIITVFSLEGGKQNLLARGTKKIISKNAAHLEPCNFINLEYVNGRQLNHITKVNPLNDYEYIRLDAMKSMIAQYASFILYSVLEEGDSDSNIFNLLKSFLNVLNCNGRTNRLLLDTFLLQLFSYLGLRPVVEHCVLCYKKENLFGFYLLGGGIVCSSCRLEKKVRQELIMACGLGARKVLIFMLSNDIAGVSRLYLTKAQYAVIQKIIFGFICYHSDKKIPNWKTVLDILQ